MIKEKAKRIELANGIKLDQKLDALRAISRQEEFIERHHKNLVLLIRPIMFSTVAFSLASYILVAYKGGGVIDHMLSITAIAVSCYGLNFIANHLREVQRDLKGVRKTADFIILDLHVDYELCRKLAEDKRLKVALRDERN